MPRFNTDQEVFNEVAHHLLTQREQAQDASGHCLYRDEENGRACAIGCCIPNEFYSPDMEEKSVQELLVEHHDTMSQVFGDDIDPRLLNELQHIHDDVSVTHWHSTLRNIAVDYGLSDLALWNLGDV